MFDHVDEADDVERVPIKGHGIEGSRVQDQSRDSGRAVRGGAGHLDSM
jgi:hypothetical protein